MSITAFTRSMGPRTTGGPVTAGVGGAAGEDLGQLLESVPPGAGHRRPATAVRPARCARRRRALPGRTQSCSPRPAPRSRPRRLPRRRGRGGRRPWPDRRRLRPTGASSPASADCSMAKAGARAASPFDVGFRAAGGLHHGQQVGAGDPFAVGQVQRRPVDALVDQIDLQLGIVLQVAHRLALRRLIERRLGDIEIAAVDHLASSADRRRSTAGSGCARRPRRRRSSSTILW